MRDAGWTLIELLVAAALAVLAASLAAAVFHSLTGGLAQSSRQALLHYNAVSVLERMISELEAGLADTPDDVVEGMGRIRIQTRADDGGTETAGLCFAAWLPTENGLDDGPVWIRYFTVPVSSDGTVRDLLRQAMPLSGAPADGCIPDDFPAQTVLRGIKKIEVHGLTEDEWVAAWPPKRDAGQPDGPAAVRIALLMDTDDRPAWAVTATAWRAMSGIRSALNVTTDRE